MMFFTYQAVRIWHKATLWPHDGVLLACPQIPLTPSELDTVTERAPSDVLLSSAVTVADYRNFLLAQDRESIAGFIHQRLYERYLKPFKSAEHKHGFAMMACGCLMVEALQSFWTGSAKSAQSGQAFQDFFNRADAFAPLRECSRFFYKHVRCGIMHQGETTGSWRVRRDGAALYDPQTQTVDATRFLSALETHLLDYCNELRESDWDSPIWQHFRRKMIYVSRGTGVGPEYLDEPLSGL
jgi:hypothetical protein